MVLLRIFISFVLGRASSNLASREQTKFPFTDFNRVDSTQDSPGILIWAALHLDPLDVDCRRDQAASTSPGTSTWEMKPRPRGP